MYNNHVILRSEMSKSVAGVCDGREPVVGPVSPLSHVSRVLPGERQPGPVSTELTWATAVCRAPTKKGSDTNSTLCLNH